MKTEDIYNELKKAYPYIIQEWPKQNDNDDRKSNFIYSTLTFEETKRIAVLNNLNLTYVMHRWYNYHTSISCEKILCDYGCTKEKELQNKEIDIYHKGTPYDVKLTVYPKKFDQGVDLGNREGKNRLIQWLYSNQSQQQRKHLANRLFIVCIGKNNSYKESLKLKANYNLLCQKIKEYIDHYRDNELNMIDIFDQGNLYTVHSDTIVVKDN